MNNLFSKLVLGILSTLAASPAWAGFFPQTITVCPAAAPEDPATFVSTVDPTDERALSYACRNTTTSCSTWSNCAVTGPDNLKYVGFVVDGMAGWLRFNQPPAGVRDTLVTHNGGQGTAWFGSRFPLIVSRLQSAAIRVVEIRWELGYQAAPGYADSAFGWYTRKNSDVKTMHEQAKRPARAIQWIKENLAQTTGKYASLSCSAGSTATAFSRLFFGQDFDYQLFGGGPWLWDTRAGCGGAFWERPAPQQWEGKFFNGGYPLRATFDYLNKDPQFPTKGACLSGSAATNPGGSFGSWAQDASGANFYVTSPTANWRVDPLHKVDFVLNRNTTFSQDDDFETGYAHQAAGIYRQLLAGSGGGLTNPNLGWHQNEGGEHCDENRSQLWCNLIKAKGLGSTALLNCNGLDQ